MSNEICEVPGHETCPAEIVPILTDSRTVAILGCSSKPDRDSFQIAEYLQNNGYRIIPVNPSSGTILGETIYPDLKSIPENVDVVDVFRHPDSLPDHLEEIIEVKPKVVWLQPGTVNEEVAQRLEETGIRVIRNRCLRTEYMVHLSKLNQNP